MHSTMSQSDIEYFCRNISDEIKRKTVRMFGTDGRKSLYNGLNLSPSFQTSEHLICMLQHKSNYEIRLVSLANAEEY